ncbi:MAG: threonine--tRNA ligase [Chloroflexi bacterium]|nr:threonine--tRNA ligase [Chloroflexota bacterium]
MSPEKTSDWLERLRHSASHIMADAMLRLFPGAKLGIGPTIEDGFYYDFDLPRPLTDHDLEAIEAKMREIIAADLPFIRGEVTPEAAQRLFRGQPYKLELIEELGAPLTIYRHGDFVDLCRGSHVESTGQIKAFKLLSVAGAYWHGDEHRPMLQRIYGTAFETEEALEAHLQRLAEAAKRDHRKLGKELDLFSVNPNIGAGLILWHPNGSIIRHQIETFWKEEHLKRGYQPVYTPHIASEEIYKISGHLEAYADMMYSPMDIDGNPYRAKPMNCPGHICIFQSTIRSYRELPIRYAELGTVYRYERSGVLHGLLRVRGFTQDDSHIFCRPDQLKQEVHGVLDLTEFMLKIFGYKYHAYLATRPEKSIGSDEEWEFATNALRQVLEERRMPYDVDEGGGVFYAPKIDVKLWDALGREWQGPTCQVDLNLPVRFNITYIGEDGKEHRVIMIHRTVLGSLERFIGGLIEHYAGAFPPWLAPVQAVIIPIADRHVGYAGQVLVKLKEKDIRVQVDDRPERMQSKIRDAQGQKVPYMLIVGDEEAAVGTVAVRRRQGGVDRGQPLEAFLEEITLAVRERANP